MLDHFLNALGFQGHIAHPTNHHDNSLTLHFYPSFPSLNSTLTSFSLPPTTIRPFISNFVSRSLDESGLRDHHRVCFKFSSDNPDPLPSTSTGRIWPPQLSQELQRWRCTFIFIFSRLMESVASCDDRRGRFLGYYTREKNSVMHTCATLIKHTLHYKTTEGKISLNDQANSHWSWCIMYCSLHWDIHPWTFPEKSIHEQNLKEELWHGGSPCMPVAHYPAPHHKQMGAGYTVGLLQSGGRSLWCKNKIK